MKEVEAGLCARRSITVTPQNTAAACGSGSLAVFGTPCLVALMEEASCLCIADYLEGDETTVGIAVQIEHLSPTPVGRQVEATARLVKAQGRKLVFEVVAKDDKTQIGKGQITRFVVDGVRFLEKAQLKQDPQ